MTLLKHLVGFANLQKLKCQKLKLFDTSFVDLPQLKTLEVRKCDFFHLSSDFFKHLANLTELYIESPSNFDHVDFQQLVNLNKLTISTFDDLGILEKFNNRLTDLKVFSFDLRENQLKLTEVMKRFTCLQVLDFSFCQIGNVDLSLISQTKKLEKLVIYKCELISLSLNVQTSNVSSDQTANAKTATSGSESAGCLRHLECLSISRTDMNRFDFKTLSHISQLSVLGLEYCRLKRVKREMFQSLTNLKHLSLNGNEIESLDDNTFADLSNLVTLNLYINQLKQVSEATFAGLVSLQYLDLSSNPMEFVDASIFLKLTKLKLVRLTSKSLQNKPKFDEMYGDRIDFKFSN